MKHCKNCQTPLTEGAKFCHSCGTKVVEETLDCPQCGTENPLSARFCANCGLSFFAKKPPHNIFEPPPTAHSEKEITKQFFDLFQKKVEEEQDPHLYAQYLERFELSDFKPSFELRVRQLAEELQTIRERSVRPARETETLLSDALEGLSDFFLIMYCQDLNVHPLPEAILKYERVHLEGVKLDQMIMDYLDFPSESDETVYTNFLGMPLELLKNASQFWLFPERNEKILFLCDQSLLGNLKEGFAMTDYAIYWKVALQKPRSVRYENLVDIKAEKDWITINRLFFHVNPNIDVKMLKLLRKLQRMFR